MEILLIPDNADKEIVIEILPTTHYAYSLAHSNHKTLKSFLALHYMIRKVPTEIWFCYGPYPS